MLPVVLLALLCAIAFHQVAAERKKSAIKGSIERQAAAHEAAIASLEVIILSGMFGVELWLAGIYTMSAPIAVLSALMALNLKEHLKDDDWLNKQRRRLNKLRRQSVKATPKLSPT